MQEKALHKKPANKKPQVNKKPHKLPLFVYGKKGAILNQKFIEMLYRRLCYGDLKHLAPALGQVLPLRLHVHKDLPNRLKLKQRWPDLNKGDRHKIIFAILRIHARRPEYLRAVAAPNSQRHDLDGKPIEPVSEEHRDYARQKRERLSRTSEISRKTL